ncbi:MAG: threonine/serine exporter family protein [Clostridia bacterium]|nr:threonine/serine exporter family protein [Clostridia bacterium]
MRVKELMEIAVKSGEILLKSGAEIYRVEDTIIRIFGAYGVQCESFVLLSGIFLSAEGEDGQVVTLVKRIKGHTIDLSRIELVNSFSRNLQENPLEYDDAKKALHTIENRHRYSFPTRLAVAGANAFVYTLIFKGNAYEGLVALLISLLIYAIKEKISEIGFFQFFEFFVSGLIAGALSFSASMLFPSLNLYKVIIGAIMILVPGVAITNGIKDALYGDTVSSLYRISEALFISVAVGSGVALALTVGFNLT